MSFSNPVHICREHDNGNLDTPYSSMETKGLLSSREVETFPKEKNSNEKNWAATALLVAGILLIVGGLGTGIGFGAAALVGTVTLAGMTILSFSATPFLIAVTSFATGIIGGCGCLMGYSKLNNA